MKSFQNYFYEAKKTFEFRVKIAATEGLDAGVQKRIREALEAFKVESITAPKRLPIQEHRDFPKVGPCECYIIDVEVNYPTIPEQIRQLVIERCCVKADCVCVYNKDQYEMNEEFEAHGKDHEGALLNDDTLKADPDGQAVAGQVRVGSLLKELEKHTRQYEFAQDSKEAGKTTADLPQGDKSPVGSTQNKIPSPVKGQK